MHPPPFLLPAAASLAALAAGPFARAAPHRYDHVVIVVEENRTPGQIVGDLTNAPYITSLANGGVSMGRMFAIEHPSQPNYLQLFSGSNQGVLNDNLPPDFSTSATASYPFDALNLGREIIDAGFSFAGFSEQLEAAGATDWADYDPHTASDPGVKYRRKHNPWANWVAKVAPVPANQMAGSVNKAFTQFPADFTLLPTVSFVVPNQDHDMHDGSRKEGDDWLSANLTAYAQWAKTHNSLLIVTWDEDDYNATNQIPTIFHGASLKNGTIAGGTWTLHNLLRTLEDMYGSTAHAGSSANVRSIVGPFSDDPAVATLTFRQGLNGYAAAQDTMVWEETPGVNNAATVDITADRDTSTTLSGNQDGQVLVRFDSLFGAAAGQVPAGAVIQSAKLIINTPANTTGTDYDSNDTFRAHRMIANWADTATWDSLTGGVSNDNVEAVSAASFSIVPDVDGGPAIFDVTADIESFQSGMPNRGWVIRPSSTGTGDGWTMKSSEYMTDPTLRPALEITYTPPADGAYTMWAAGKGLTSANNGALLDPEKDGVVNLLEFAFNLNPLAVDPVEATPSSLSGLPFGKVVAVPGGKALELTFLRRKAPGGASLTYSPQFSASLTSWTAGLAPAVVPIDAEWERVTVRDSAAVTSPRRFVRVSVTSTP